MQTTIRWLDSCVFLLFVGLLGFGSTCASAEEGSYTWQPEGLKQVYGTENGHHWEQVHAVDFGPDGDWLVSGGGDRNVFVWETETLKPIAFAHSLPAPVQSLSTHPSGKFIAMGLQNGQVWICGFDGQKLTELHRLTGYPYLTGVRYTPDGSKLVVLTNQLTYFYDVTGPRPIETRVLKSGGSSFDISQDSCRLAIVERKKLSVWEIFERKPKKIAEQEWEFVAVAFSPDGQTIATGERSAVSPLAIWKIEDGELTKRTDWGPKTPVQLRSIRFSPDGKWLVANTYSSRDLQAWNVDRIPDEVVILPGQEGSNANLEFSADGSRLVSGDGTSVRIWEFDDEPAEATQSVDRFNRFTDVSYFGLRLIAVTNEKVSLPDSTSLVAWKSVLVDLSSGKKLDPPSYEPAEGIANGNYNRVLDSYSPDGNRGALLMQGMISEPDKVPGMRGYIRIDPLFKETEDRFPSSIVLKGLFASMAWSNDSKQLATGSEGKLQCWDSITGEQVAKTSVDGQASSLRYMPDGRIIAVQQKQNELADYDKHLVIWNPNADGQDALKTRPISSRSKIDQARISPRGNYLALRQRGKPIDVYHFDGEQLNQTCELNVDGQYFMDDFSPSGELLALHTWGGAKHLVGLFDARNGKKVQEWQPLGSVNEVRFSPDGTELALANGNTTVYVLNVPPTPSVAMPTRFADDDKRSIEFTPATDDADLRARFEKLNAESEAANKKWREPPNNRKGEPPFLRFAKQFMEIGESAPEIAASRDALIQVCGADRIAGYDDQNKEITRLQKTATRLLMKYHFLDPKILPAVEVMSYSTKDVRRTARRFIREHPHRDVQARASLVLARSYDGQLRSSYRTLSSDKEVVISLYQRLIDNYDGLHFWEGGPSYRSIAEENIKRLKAK